MTAHDIDFNQVKQIYYGKDHYCRCGCGGKYAYPGSKGFTRYANAIINLGGIEFVQEDEQYINISLPNNRAYTIYFS